MKPKIQKDSENLPTATVVDLTSGVYTKCKSDGSPYTQKDVDNYNNSLPWWERWFSKVKLSDYNYTFSKEIVLKRLIVPLRRGKYEFGAIVIITGSVNDTTSKIENMFAVCNGSKEEISPINQINHLKDVEKLTIYSLTVKNRTIADFALRVS